MKRHLQGIFATLLLVFAAASVSAGPHHGDRGHRGPPGGPEMDGAVLRHLGGALKQLELSDAQRDQIQPVLEQGREDLMANHRASMDNKLRMRELLDGNDLDDAGLQDIARAEGALAEERVLIVGRALADVLAVLDESQRAELQAMAEDHRARRQARRDDVAE